MRTVNSALRAATLSLSLVAAAVGCGPRAQNEEQYWNVHQSEIAEVGGRWPGFKALLAARLEKARPAWEAALKIGDEKEKAQKMHDANALLADGLLSRMLEVKYKAKGIEDTVARINNLSLPLSRAAERQASVEAARRSVDEVEGAMIAARPASEGDAMKLLDDHVSRLISDQGSADRAYKRLKPEPVKKKK
jgi:hypothetical protein